MQINIPTNAPRAELEALWWQYSQESRTRLSFAISLRVFPLPNEYRTAWEAYEEISDAVQAIEKKISQMPE
jgi:hypothetical protein